MIVSMYVAGFKSLSNFNIEFDKFNCLIGLNGAGKSTVLQVLDFASAIANNKIETWLDKRLLAPADVASKINVYRGNISIGVAFFVMENNMPKRYLWHVILSRTTLALRSETLSFHDGDHAKLSYVFRYFNGGYSFYDGDVVPSHYEIKGSMLANFAKQKDFKLISPEHLDAFRSLFGIRSFELLAPHLLRRSQKRDSSVSDIGIGGEYLGVFVHNLSDKQRADLVVEVRKFYPQVVSIETKVRKFGWIELIVNENLALVSGDDVFDVHQEHKAKVLNDGMLRVIAILAQKYSNHSTILFDEIENGVNAEVAEKIVRALLELDKQVIVTTHSPMLMNYIPEDIAKESVHLVYRRADGKTKETLFFDIPMVKDKLDFLAPGDAMLDVHLEEVAAEAEYIARIKEEEEKAEKEKKKTANKPDQVK